MTDLITIAETQPVPLSGRSLAATEVYETICSLFGWLEKNDYRGYDTFDGLSAKYLCKQLRSQKRSA